MCFVDDVQWHNHLHVVLYKLVFVFCPAIENILTCNYSSCYRNDTGISATRFLFFPAQCSSVLINLQGKMLSIQTAPGKMMSQKISPNLQ